MVPSRTTRSHRRLVVRRRSRRQRYVCSLQQASACCRLRHGLGAVFQGRLQYGSDAFAAHRGGCRQSEHRASWCCVPCRACLANRRDRADERRRRHPCSDATPLEMALRERSIWDLRGLLNGGKRRAKLGSTRGTARSGSRRSTGRAGSHRSSRRQSARGDSSESDCYSSDSDFDSHEAHTVDTDAVLRDFLQPHR